MNNLDTKIAHKRTDFVKIIDREQELLDLLNQELKNGTASSANRQDVLEQNHLSERPVTREEEAMIKKLMTDQANRFEKAWYLENEDVRAKMDAFCKANHFGDNDVTWLFHGTRPENIWSIEKNGLYLNPAILKTNVHITGKAYGYGIYRTVLLQVHGVRFLELRKRAARKWISSVVSCCNRKAVLHQP